MLGLWFIPVLLVPSVRPLYAITTGQFDQWIDGVLWQSERENSGLLIALGKLFAIDPVFVILSLGGFIYAALLKRRDILLLLWIVPFIVFNLLSGYVLYWHLAPLLPAFCTEPNQINDYKNYYNDGDIRTKYFLFVVNENFIYDMTRDNNTERNIEGLRTLYVNSSSLATIEEDKQMIPNQGNYPFSSLIDLDPKAPTKVEIRVNH